VTAAPVTLSQ